MLAAVSTAWRTGGGDQDSSSGWQEVFASADAICPWTVRRYRDEDDANSFYESVVTEDVRFLQNENIRLVPTVFPGFSVSEHSYTLWKTSQVLLMKLGNALRSDEFNEIPRQGGKFLWRQLDNAQRLNPPMIYAAMFDEYGFLSFCVVLSVSQILRNLDSNLGPLSCPPWLNLIFCRDLSSSSLVWTSMVPLIYLLIGTYVSAVWPRARSKTGIILKRSCHVKSYL